jgi:glycine cleavage system T protein (aminomethyltransferase)
VITRNVQKLKVGQVYYTGWCDDEGKMIDDGTVSRLEENVFRMTSADPSLRWLSMNAVGMDVDIKEVTDDIAALSFQGPNTRKVLNLCCERSVDELKYFRVMKNKIRNVELTISRTGYTGDLGYEIWMQNKDALTIWDTLMEVGHGYGISPVGILAMDMARVEAGLFMIEVDYTAANHAWIDAQKSTPFELGLDWTVALDKPGYFVGRRALEREKKEGSAWKLMGLDIDWPGMEKLYESWGLPPAVPAMAIRASIPVYQEEMQVGYVSTSSWSPLLKKYIALVHLERPYYEAGTDVKMEITVQHQRKQAPAKVVKLPFYEPEWKKK